MKYDVKSEKAEEFINHQEILDTLEYGKGKIKTTESLIKEIPRKGKNCQGFEPQGSLCAFIM
jgi:2-iminoacetate synthase